MIQFKDSRLEKEFHELPVHNSRLAKLADALSMYCSLEFNKDVVITCIFRSKAENDALYAKTPPEKRPPSSPHMTWEAFDIRSSTFLKPEIDKILRFLNSFSYRNGRPVSIYHSIAGNAPHFHIQFASKTQ